MVRELEDNVCQHNLFTIGKSLIMCIGFMDWCYCPFYTDKRTTEDLVLHNDNARYDSPNRWWRYRFFRLFRLPFNVKYKWVGNDKPFKVRPEIWIRLYRIKD